MADGVIVDDRLLYESAMSSERQGPVDEWLIGVDTGGTFTDCVIAGPGGLSLGKALSTPGELWRGIIQSIADASKGVGGLELVLSRASVLAHGTNGHAERDAHRKGRVVGILFTCRFRRYDPNRPGSSEKVAGLAELEAADIGEPQEVLSSSATSA